MFYHLMPTSPLTCNLSVNAPMMHDALFGSVAILIVIAAIWWSPKGNSLQKKKLWLPEYRVANKLIIN